MLRYQFPKQVKLDEDEIAQVNRLRLAQLLHKTPGEIDAMPLEDALALLDLIRADEQIEAIKAQRMKARQRSRMPRRRR